MHMLISISMQPKSTFVLVLLNLKWLYSHAADLEEPSIEDPSHPVCRVFSLNSLSFCSMVNYAAVVNETDLDGAAFDRDAELMYNGINRVLSRFDCMERYSLHNCDDCRLAYKYWACSFKFQSCGGDLGSNHTQCFDGDCKNHNECCNEGRRKTCLSICEDVVRKCPYVVNFNCPQKENRDYSGNGDTCNKLNHTVNPEKEGEAWPGTFGNSASNGRDYSSSVWLKLMSIAVPVVPLLLPFE